MAPTYKDLVLQLACRCAWSTSVRMCMQEGISGRVQVWKGTQTVIVTRSMLHITSKIDIVQEFDFFHQKTHFWDFFVNCCIDLLRR